jgi:hypothetical protein
LPEAQTANWIAVLAAMEAGLAVANDAKTWDDDEVVPAVVWVIPDAIGPLPSSLRDHATQVVKAQDETIRRLEDRREVMSRHLAALRSIPAAQGGNSAYLDVTA